MRFPRGCRTCQPRGAMSLFAAMLLALACAGERMRQTGSPRVGSAESSPAQAEPVAIESIRLPAEAQFGASASQVLRALSLWKVRDEANLEVNRERSRGAS